MYTAQGIFQHHFQCKKVRTILDKNGKLDVFKYKLLWGNYCLQSLKDFNQFSHFFSKYFYQIPKENNLALEFRFWFWLGLFPVINNLIKIYNNN